MSSPTAGKNPPGINKGSDGNQGSFIDAGSQRLCKTIQLSKKWAPSAYTFILFIEKQKKFQENFIFY